MSYISVTKYDGRRLAVRAYDIDWVSEIEVTHQPDGEAYPEPVTLCRIHVKSGEMFDVIDEFNEVGQAIEACTVVLEATLDEILPSAIV